MGTWPYLFAVLFALAVPLRPTTAAIPRNYDFVFEHAGGEYHSDYFRPETRFFLDDFNQTDKTKALNLIMEAHKALPNNSILEMNLLEKHDTKYIQSFIKYRSSFCDFLRTEKREIFIAFKKALTFPSSCPFQGSFRMKNFLPGGVVPLPPVWPGPEEHKMNMIISSGSSSVVFVKSFLTFRLDRSKGGRGRKK